jgi:hypothetical protein
VRATVHIALASATLAIAASRPAATTRSSVAPPSVAGTYHLAICRGTSCTPDDSATAYVLATVVLLDSAGAVAADMPPSRYEPPNRRATGCMVIRHRRDVSGGSHAGLMGRGYFIWRDSAGYIHFPMYKSPDAGYAVRVRPTAAGLTGGGQSWGVEGITPIRPPRDTVVATRTGPANRLWCHAPETRER